ncbi:uncharacterized protein LOC102375692 [Alligator sinensis]|uniref:Uncharacterized protein LOC102375692 n=1 Tax=Alligator sinensis TaxID=38654 RepID=A0A1U7RX25_ALLSI|nr:uncharacterized protein LOC102375692 [Alligator sinensis]
MNIINTLLFLLFALLAGLILIFGLIVMFCILIFSTRLTFTIGEAKMVTMFEKGATEFTQPIPATKSEVTHLKIEFDKAELIAKLAKEIAPDYCLNMKISLKNQTLAAISLKVEPKDNTWNAKANIQIKTDTLEDSELDEQRFIFTCKQLNGTCTLTSYNIQNEPSFQQLQLSDIVRVILQAFYGPLKVPSDVQHTDPRGNIKTEEVEESYQISEE